MEARFKSSEEMEKVKNRAVDAVSKVGEEALLEVCYAWAGVSKRRILQGSVGEEEKALLMEELREYVKGGWPYPRSAKRDCILTIRQNSEI